MPGWPYLPTLERLSLALAVGLFVGLEREHRGKEAGLRTFGFVALLGGIGGLLGESYALLSLALVGVLIVLLNVYTIRANEGPELTTSAALLVTAFSGVLAGQGHTFTPPAVAVTTAALLTWKQPLAGFSRGLTDSEIRSAILLGMLAFVIYPVLPPGYVDRWDLLDARAAWVIVILIAGLGFVNYVLLKLYGAKGIVLTGFLGGLVNSTVAVTELASRDRASNGRFTDVAYTGVLLSTLAMMIRNVVLLALLAPPTLAPMALAYALMLLGGAALVFFRRTPATELSERSDAAPLLQLASPFSITAALEYGLLFLALQIAGTLGQRALGHAGFYAVSVLGGVVSSASAVASAASLNAHGTLTASAAAVGAILATAVSALVNCLIAARVSHDASLARRLTRALGALVALGILGALVQGAAMAAIGRM